MALKQVLQQKILLGLDAKRAYCNYRGLGSYSRLLVESLIRWSGSQPLELSLFTPKISLNLGLRCDRSALTGRQPLALRSP